MGISARALSNSRRVNSVMLTASHLAAPALLVVAVLIRTVPARFAAQDCGSPLRVGDVIDVSPCDDHEGRCWKTDALAGPWHIPHWCLFWLP